MDEVEKGFKRIEVKEWSREKVGSWRSAKGYLKIPDRREAIQTAIRLAQPSDTVLIAGKGHEDYQIVGTTRHHFDDREQARMAIAKRAVRTGARGAMKA